MCLGGSSRPTPTPQPAPAAPLPDPEGGLQTEGRRQRRQAQNLQNRTQVTGPGGVTNFGASSATPQVFGSTGTIFI